MTHTLVFDTETTGLPPRTRTRTASLSEMPWVIQLACILFRDSDQAEIGHFSTYVLPTHGDLMGAVPVEKFWIENKLTMDHIAPTAMPLDTTMKIFNQFCRRATRIVAHNMAFDMPRIAECHERIGAPDTNSFSSLPRFCTMTTLTPIMQLPANWPRPGQEYKWPNLDEAYRRYCDPAGFDSAHDAMADVRACASLMYAIEKQGIALLAA